MPGRHETRSQGTGGRPGDLNRLRSGALRSLTMKRLLHTLCGSQKTRRHMAARPATTRPSVETLEERSCLSVSVTNAPGSGVLSIIGDDFDNKVWVTQDDAAGRLTVEWQ